MRIFDFTIQSILLLTAFGFLFSGEAGLIIILLVQFILGCWQLVSALATTFNTRSVFRKKMIRAYWLSVVVYFTVLGSLHYTGKEELLYIWFFFAWMIALFYYFVSLRLAFYETPAKPTFMDIAN